MLRFFYGASFSKMVALAFVLNAIGIPLMQGFFSDRPAIAQPLGHINVSYTVSLAILAVYVLPIHIGWLLFMHVAKDGRYDVDNPGRPLLPFIHPWLIDFPVAIGLPFAVSALGAAGVVFTVPVPQSFGIGNVEIHTNTAWWLTSVIVSGAYLVAAILTVEPPRFSFKRWRLRRQKPQKLRFDLARVAIKPFR